MVHAPAFRSKAPLEEAIVFFLSVLMLSGAALINGLPLVYYDAGSYMRIFIELHYFWDRPVYYGIFAGILARGSLWPIIFAQAGIVYVVIRTTIVYSGYKCRLHQIFLVVALLSVATSLPWYAGQITPDVFTAPLILSIYLMVFKRECIPGYLYCFLFLLLCLAQSVHYSHLALGLSLTFALLILGLLFRKSRLVRPGNLLPIAASSGLTMVAFLAVNYAARGEVVLAPASPVFLVARFIEDGLAQTYLDQACPTHPYRLCAYIDRLPPRASDFLFAADSPLADIGGGEAARAEASAIVVGSLYTDPVRHAWSALKDFARQVVSFETGSGLIPYLGGTRIAQIIQESYPREYISYLGSREVRQTIDFSLINRVHVPVAFVALLLNVAVLAVALRRSRPDLALLVGVVLLGIGGNALITSVLSAADARYQSRVIWLAVLSACIGLGALRQPRRHGMGIDNGRAPAATVQVGVAVPKRLVPPVPAVLIRALRAYASPQFALFIVFGGAAALVNLAAGVILYDRGLLPGLPYWISVSIAAASGLIVNFALNYCFNLKFRQRSALEQFGTFCVIAVIGIMLTVAIADALLRLATASEVTELSLPLGHAVSMRFAMHVCAVGIVTFYSYAAHRYFSFNVGIRSRLRPILSRRG